MHRNSLLKLLLGAWCITLIVITGLSSPLLGQEPVTPQPKLPGSLSKEDLRGFEKNSEAIQRLLIAALELSSKELIYKMGSANPENGGMDCSGTLYYLLRSVGVTEVPRDSAHQYQWAWEANTFVAVNGIAEKTYEFSRLRPGHLLFWVGTYDVGNRNPPVSHVMIYLGKRASDGKDLMFGASNGRTYNGQSRYGVGVFDFNLPSAKSSTRFIGYAQIPGIEY